MPAKLLKDKSLPDASLAEVRAYRGRLTDEVDQLPLVG